MGRFVNPDNSAFQVALNSPIYVDKTGLLEYTNSVLNTTEAYICNCRPRRFGKSYAANMLAAYYSKGCNSEEMFSGLDISRESDFKAFPGWLCYHGTSAILLWQHRTIPT